MSASSSYDVIVIGAGIIGAAIAWELNSAGRRVTIVDRGDPGMGCSYGNAAHFATEQIFPIASPAIPALLRPKAGPAGAPLGSRGLPELQAAGLAPVGA